MAGMVLILHLLCTNMYPFRALSRCPLESRFRTVGDHENAQRSRSVNDRCSWRTFVDVVGALLKLKMSDRCVNFVGVGYFACITYVYVYVVFHTARWSADIGAPIASGGK